MATTQGSRITLKVTARKGVYLRIRRVGNERIVRHFAVLTARGGKQRMRLFSLSRYGHEAAWQHAVRFRLELEQAVARQEEPARAARRERKKKNVQVWIEKNQQRHRASKRAWREAHREQRRPIETAKRRASRALDAKTAGIPGPRYTYLGSRGTRADLIGAQCDPVRNAAGKCVVSQGMGTALVTLTSGERCVVIRRRLRLNEKEGC